MRLHKIARPPRPSEAELREAFWNAPMAAPLDRDMTAAGLGYSGGWLELRATKGDGPPFLKAGHRVRYVKREVLEWWSKYARRMTSTSDKPAAKRVGGPSVQSPSNANTHAPKLGKPERQSPFVPTDAPEPEAA